MHVNVLYACERGFMHVNVPLNMHVNVHYACECAVMHVNVLYAFECAA